MGQMRHTSDDLFVPSDVAQTQDDAKEPEPSREASWAATPSAEVYPTPQEIVAHLVATGQEVPRFLLPPKHGMHVPPHIVAYSLMSSIAGDDPPEMGKKKSISVSQLGTSP